MVGKQWLESAGAVDTVGEDDSPISTKSGSLPELYVVLPPHQQPPDADQKKAAQPAGHLPEGLGREGPELAGKPEQIHSAFEVGLTKLSIRCRPKPARR